MDHRQPLEPPYFDPEAIPEKKRLAGVRWTSRLFNGFHREALKVLKRSAFDESEVPAYRIALLQALVRWHEREAQRRSEPVSHDVDVLIVSDLSLPGGTTSSNVADVLALRKAGLRVALFHHPSYELDAVRGVSAKIRALAADDEGLRLVGAEDQVRTRLTIVRFPPCMTRLIDQRPRVATARTVLVVNQAPYYYYGDEPRRRSWRIAEVHENLKSWLGEHEWYCASPTVKALLERFHAEEIGEVRIADDYWFDITDAGRRDAAAERRPREGRISIGRHSRDSKLKWPSDAERLRACYPQSDDFTINVLGGAEAPRRLLGELPANWTVHGFDTMDVEAFLSGIDVMVYYLSDDGIEAFGRAPLEAMAAGVPCVLDPRLEPTFGDAALYPLPEDVERTVRDLVADPDAYAEQARRGLARVRSAFSGDRLVARAASLIAEARPGSPSPGFLSRVRTRALRAGAGR